MYISQEEINALAAAAGFAVGDYVHHYARTYRVAGRIKSFSMLDGELTVSWMDGATSCRLSEVRLSVGHRRAPQFGPGFDFFTSPALITEALRQAQVAEDLIFNYTGAWVSGFGTRQVEVWATSDPLPRHEYTAFMRVSNAPGFYEPSEESVLGQGSEEAPVPVPVPVLPQGVTPEQDYKMQVLASGQLITEKSVQVQMKVSAKKAKQLFKQMQNQYSTEKPTMLHLALFSGATDLLAMIKALREAGATYETPAPK